jgi:cytochrome c553
MSWLLTARTLICTGALAISSISLAEELEGGQYQYCLLCHGSAGQGNSVVKAPAIAGIDEFYLRQQMASYRMSIRGDDYQVDPEGAEMAAVARVIADHEVDEIIRLLSSVQSNAPSHTGVEGDMDTGKASYTQMCAACHGAAAQGNELMKAPGLVHLNDWYVVSSFNKYVNGVRGKSAQDSSAQQMRAIVQGLPENFSIEDIAVYIRSIKVGDKNN